jgi:hypothetical protein
MHSIVSRRTPRRVSFLAALVALSGACRCSC